jgi:hypothetical protein
LQTGSIAIAILFLLIKNPWGFYSLHLILSVFHWIKTAQAQ